MFVQANRKDMVEITHRVAGKEAEQEGGVNDKGANTKQNEKVNSEQNKGTIHEAHHSTLFSKLWEKYL